LLQQTATNGRERGAALGVAPKPGSKAAEAGAAGADMNALARGQDGGATYATNAGYQLSNVTDALSVRVPFNGKQVTLPILLALLCTVPTQQLRLSKVLFVQGDTGGAVIGTLSTKRLLEALGNPPVAKGDTNPSKNRLAIVGPDEVRYVDHFNLAATALLNYHGFDVNVISLPAADTNILHQARPVIATLFQATMTLKAAPAGGDVRAAARLALDAALAALMKMLSSSHMMLARLLNAAMEEVVTPTPLGDLPDYTLKQRVHNKRRPNKRSGGAAGPTPKKKPDQKH
jgi:hypothetical protein